MNNEDESQEKILRNGAIGYEFTIFLCRFSSTVPHTTRQQRSDNNFKDFILLNITWVFDFFPDIVPVQFFSSTNNFLCYRSVTQVIIGGEK